MPAIGRFVSFDGGVAFSERVMKLQKRGQEAVMIPLDDVAAVRVRRPQEDSDGFIRIETADGKRYRIFFEDDQLQEAVRFKRRFEDTVSDGEDEALAPAPPRPERQSRYEGNARLSRAYPGGAPRKPIFKRWWFWAACAVLVIGRAKKTIPPLAPGPKWCSLRRPAAFSQRRSRPAAQWT